MKKDKPEYRIGFGYDVHRWAEGRDLILGGVQIPNWRGLLGHSDADVLTHAAMDALLGSVSLGDIGQHFPNTDPQYEGVRSVDLLEHVIWLVEQEEYSPANVDCTVVAEEPKLAPHIPSMRECLAACMRLPLTCVSVKATTTEGLLYTGNEGGIAAYAVVLVIAHNKKNGK